ncbi:hypothetical protein P3G55_08200 [Leptospira sp. 96542]|nr:hypothetical protein [Leptospira sp. 96542]
MFDQKMQSILNYFNKHQMITLGLFVFIWGVTTLSVWKRYEWNPTSMINFGLEFADLNKRETPANAVLFKGEEGNLGAGYDGQIFYYYSRTLSNFNLDWPLGFDQSYRAPRIGFPFLISLFGIFGKYAAIFGMYFWNVSLLLGSYFCLRSLLSAETKPFAIFYLLNPFALGSYYLLVSDSVMVSLVVIAYYLYIRTKYFPFVITASLAILTKEPALFLFFPLGLKELFSLNWKKIFIVASILIIPIFWHSYLSFTFPEWRVARLTDFILPFEGLVSYMEVFVSNVIDFTSAKEFVRVFQRFPLVFAFFIVLFLPFTGKLKHGYEFRIGILLVMFMVGTAGFYHFWSIYDNVARMFTLSVPLIILLRNADGSVVIKYYFYTVLFILILFLIKTILFAKTMPYQIGF